MRVDDGHREVDTTTQDTAFTAFTAFIDAGNAQASPSRKTRAPEARHPSLTGEEKAVKPVKAAAAVDAFLAQPMTAVSSTVI